MTEDNATQTRYLTLRETAELTGTAYATLRRDIDSGQLSAYKVGRKYFIAADAADRYAAQKRQLAAIDGYTIREILDILPLSYAYVIELIKNGRLTAVKRGRRYIVPKTALSGFLNEARMS